MAESDVRTMENSELKGVIFKLDPTISDAEAGELVDKIRNNTNHQLTAAELIVEAYEVLSDRRKIRRAQKRSEGGSLSQPRPRSLSSSSTRTFSALTPRRPRDRPGTTSSTPLSSRTTPLSRRGGGTDYRTYSRAIIRNTTLLEISADKKSGGEQGSVEAMKAYLESASQCAKEASRWKLVAWNNRKRTEVDCKKAYLVVKETTNQLRRCKEAFETAISQDELDGNEQVQTMAHLGVLRNQLSKARAFLSTQETRLRLAVTQQKYTEANAKRAEDLVVRAHIVNNKWLTERQTRSRSLRSISHRLVEATTTAIKGRQSLVKQLMVAEADRKAGLRLLDDSSQTIGELEGKLKKARGDIKEESHTVDKIRQEHNRELCALRASVSRQISDKSRENSAQLSDLTDRYESTLRSLRLEKSREISEISEKLHAELRASKSESARKIAEVSEEYEKKIMEIRAERAREISEKSLEISEIVAKHEREMGKVLEEQRKESKRKLGDMRAAHRKEMEDLHTKNADHITTMEVKKQEQLRDLEAKKSKELTEVITELRDAQKSQIAQIRSQAAVESAQLKDQLAAKLHAFQKSKALEMSEMADKHRQEILSLVSDNTNEVKALSDKHEAEIQRRVRQNSASTTALREKHAKEIQAVRDAHSDTITELHKKHQASLQALDEDRQGEASAKVESMRARHEKEMRDREADKSRQISEMRKKHEEAMMSAGDEFERRIVVLKRQHAQSLSEVEGAKAKTLAELQGKHRDELRAVRENASREISESVSKLESGRRDHSQNFARVKAEIKASHDKELAELKAKHHFDMQALREATSREISEKASELESQRVQFEGTLKSVRESAARDTALMKRNHADEVEALREETIAEAKKAEGEKKRATKRISQLEKVVVSIKESHNDEISILQEEQVNKVKEKSREMMIKSRRIMSDMRKKWDVERKLLNQTLEEEKQKGSEKISKLEKEIAAMKENRLSDDAIDKLQNRIASMQNSHRKEVSTIQDKRDEEAKAFEVRLRDMGREVRNATEMLNTKNRNMSTKIQHLEAQLRETEGKLRISKAKLKAAREWEENSKAKSSVERDTPSNLIKKSHIDKKLLLTRLGARVAYLCRSHHDSVKVQPQLGFSEKAINSVRSDVGAPEDLKERRNWSRGDAVWVFSSKDSRWMVGAVVRTNQVLYMYIYIYTHICIYIHIYMHT
ncbi:hypothetical protein AAMO2058_001145900 [Amorphochlora amoebiformis]